MNENSRPRKILIFGLILIALLLLCTYLTSCGEPQKFKYTMQITYCDGTSAIIVKITSGTPMIDNEQVAVPELYFRNTRDFPGTILNVCKFTVLTKEPL